MAELKHGTGGVLGQVAGRSNGGKSLMHTIDPDFILGIGRISAFGARKYHHRNFLMAPGMKWSDVYESLLRHLMAYWDGEELDIGPNGEHGPTDDPATNMKWSGMPHLLHVAWNVMVLYTYSRHKQYGPGDNRPSKVEWEDRRWTDWDDAFRHMQELGVPAKSEDIAKINKRTPSTWGHKEQAEYIIKTAIARGYKIEVDSDVYGDGTSTNTITITYSKGKS